MSEFAELNVEGKSYKLPLIEGSEKEKGFDISKLRGESGLITVDTGYKNTGATQSAITFLDGEKGVRSLSSSLFRYYIFFYWKSLFI